MSNGTAKTIKLHGDMYEATYYKGSSDVELYCPERMDTIFVTKQDLIDILKLVEEEDVE